MAITANQIQKAKLIQDVAAQDINQAVRLVAGPGTGKSFVIEGRVSWLIQNNNISPDSIIAVSFTRASANDLRDRIYKKGISEGINNINRVRISTLHSLALYILRKLRPKNTKKSKIRARVEHVFGFMEQSMNGLGFVTK